MAIIVYSVHKVRILTRTLKNAKIVLQVSCMTKDKRNVNAHHKISTYIITFVLTVEVHIFGIHKQTLANHAL